MQQDENVLLGFSKLTCRFPDQYLPFMTTGAGVDLLGWWFGTGTGRGLALLFTVAGLVGLTVTLLAMRSTSYRLLSQNYQNSKVDDSYHLLNLKTQPAQVLSANSNE